MVTVIEKRASQIEFTAQELLMNHFLLLTEYGKDFAAMMIV